MTVRRKETLVLLAGLAAATSLRAAEAKKSEYRGWQSLELNNGLIQVQIVPAIGGRVIQFKLGEFEYLWVNDRLAGKQPPAGGLAADGGWLNYGGDKLWPAPQGWANDEQWPGPPDPVLDGSPHAGEITTACGPAADVTLISQPDKRSGIQFSRVIRISDNAAHLSFDSTMKNIDTQPRRWSIWQVTQLNAGNRQGQGYNTEMRCYSPINPASVHRRGYVEMFGLVNNPSFTVDADGPRLVAHYRNIVGKAGIDNSAGWVATVDGEAGYVFVERFPYFPGKPYPDDTSATFWMNGAGKFVCGTNVVDARDDPVTTPYLVESEVLSPMASLKPGESYSFRVDWFAARIGGNYPVLDCTAAGVTCERLTAKIAGNAVRCAGRFGVFYPGKAELVFLSRRGEERARYAVGAAVTPTEPLVLSTEQPAAAGAATVSLELRSDHGDLLGEVASARIEK